VTDWKRYPRSSTPRCGSPVPGDHPRKASCERLWTSPLPPL